MSEGTRLVIAREFLTRVRERAFRTSTAAIILMIAVVIALPSLVGLTRFKVGVVGPQAHAVVAAAKAQAKLGKVTITIEDLPDDGTAREEAGKGDVAAALMSDGTIVTRQYLPDQLKPFLLAAVAGAAQQERLARAHVDPRLLAPVEPRVVSVRPDSQSSKQQRNLAFAGVLLLFGMLFTYGTQVASGVVEEKSSRVVEVVLSAIRPRQLLLGKIVGIGLVGLLQLSIIAAVGVGGAVWSGTLDLNGATLKTMGQIGLWFLLGYAFLATAFAAGAATVSRSEDLQQVIAPFATLNFAAIVLGVYASQHPTSGLTEVLSYVPPFSPIVMTPRWAGGEVPLWQVGASMAVMLLAIALLARLGARVYEGAVLRLGARVRLRDALAR